jgi:hypothetical protein
LGYGEGGMGQGARGSGLGRFFSMKIDS